MREAPWPDSESMVGDFRGRGMAPQRPESRVRDKIKDRSCPDEAEVHKQPGDHSRKSGKRQIHAPRLAWAMQNPVLQRCPDGGEHGPHDGEDDDEPAVTEITKPSGCACGEDLTPVPSLGPSGVKIFEEIAGESFVLMAGEHVLQQPGGE